MDRRVLRARQLDRERARHTGEEAQLLLLKADGGARAYKELLAVADSWAPLFSEQPGARFEVARADDDFNAAVREASNMVVTNSTNQALEGQLLAIDRDTTAPVGDYPRWRITAGFTGKRYTQQP